MAKDSKKTKDESAVALEERPLAEVESNVEETQETTALEKPEAKQTRETVQITYYENAKVICSSCSTTFTIGSTKPEIHVEICNSCHPLYTGKAKFVDTEGRVEAFQRREAAKKEPKEKKKVATEPERPKTLKEMLEFIQSDQ